MPKKVVIPPDVERMTEKYRRIQRYFYDVVTSIGWEFQDLDDYTMATFGVLHTTLSLEDLRRATMDMVNFRRFVIWRAKRREQC